MATLYLTEQGSTLHKTSRRLTVTKDEKVILEVPEFKIERIFVFGNIQLTTQAIAFLLNNGIETSFFSFTGRLKGKLSPIESKNVFLRIEQYKKLQDDGFRLRFAKLVVKAKLKNAKTLLLRYQRSYQEIKLGEYLSEIDRCIKTLKRKEKLPTVTGIEGQASSAYFRVFGKLFRKKLSFGQRTRRPPKDPVNALLSLGYTMITNEIISMVSAVGFDPYIGFYHGVNYGRPSLALDLVEEFRHPIVDTLTLNLVNNDILKENDFMKTEECGYYLKEDARKKYFLHYERKLTNEFKLHNTSEIVSFRKLFSIQAHKLQKMLMEGEPYRPFLMA